ncbi:MAG: type II toxin-antitoxin system PemK/MazF family toxin [Pedobacter sp.]|nr:type II toxin-antitoxin system PemK/MazF family toxin [Chitinophagaceae bacterium]
MTIHQPDIVEVNFQLPNGKFKVHPALVISNQNVLDTEDIFYAVMISSKSFNDEFTFELNNNMLTKPLSKTSFVKCQLIQAYSTDEVINKISTIKSTYFQQIKQTIFDTVF